MYTNSDGMHPRVLRVSLWVCCLSALTGYGDWGGPWWTDEKGKCHAHLQEGWERGSRELQAKQSNLSLLEDFSSWKPFLSLWSARRWLEIGSMSSPRANCFWSTWLADHGKTTGSMDKGGVVNIVYLDFSKAFPKVFDSILTSQNSGMWSG